MVIVTADIDVLISGSGSGVELVHPVGSTITSLPGGVDASAYRGAFVGGGPRCLSCRHQSGIKAVEALHVRVELPDGVYYERDGQLWCVVHSISGCRTCGPPLGYVATGGRWIRALEGLEHGGSAASSEELRAAIQAEIPHLMDLADELGYPDAQRHRVMRKKSFLERLYRGRMSFVIGGSVVLESEGDDEEQGTYRITQADPEQVVLANGRELRLAPRLERVDVVDERPLDPWTVCNVFADDALVNVAIVTSVSDDGEIRMSLGY